MVSFYTNVLRNIKVIALTFSIDVTILSTQQCASNQIIMALMALVFDGSVQASPLHTKT